MNQGMMFLLMEPEKKVAVVLGYTLTAISFRKKTDTWLMVVSVTTDKDNYMVAFIEMSSVYDCWWYFNEALTKTSAPLVWRVDKYRKNNI